MISSYPYQVFYDLYESDVHIYAGDEPKAFLLRVSSAQQRLIDCLSDVGMEEDVDFDVEWDLGLRYFVCGSIHDPEKLSDSLVRGVLKAFSVDLEPNLWVCHFWIENPNSRSGNQFYIKGNGDIVIEDKPGWETVFERLKDAPT